MATRSSHRPPVLTPGTDGGVLQEAAGIRAGEEYGCKADPDQRSRVGRRTGGVPPAPDRRQTEGIRDHDILRFSDPADVVQPKTEIRQLFEGGILPPPPRCPSRFGSRREAKFWKSGPLGIFVSFYFVLAHLGGVSKRCPCPFGINLV